MCLKENIILTILSHQVNLHIGYRHGNELNYSTCHYHVSRLISYQYPSVLLHKCIDLSTKIWLLIIIMLQSHKINNKNKTISKCICKTISEYTKAWKPAESKQRMVDHFDMLLLIYMEVPKVIFPFLRVVWMVVS